MAKQTKEMYALRHRETGRFFRFDQLNDDGYREYVADVTTPDSDELPSFFAEHTLTYMNEHQGGLPIYGCRRPRGGLRENCTVDEVEWVKFTLSW